nr:hypothetical protein CFP56_41363 [Quercus suber]
MSCSQFEGWCMRTKLLTGQTSSWLDGYRTVFLAEHPLSAAQDSKCYLCHCYCELCGNFAQQIPAAWTEFPLSGRDDRTAARCMIQLSAIPSFMALDRSRSR